ncbi:MAG TPA: PIN domain nuclease [Conexibacter sp.]
MGPLILADSSAWIEYLRATESDTDLQLDGLLRRSARVATTDLVLLEVLSGAQTQDNHDRWQGLLYSCEYLRSQPPLDYEAGARIYRTCRRGGETVRAPLDCVIAAIAMRCKAAVLTKDRDFETIARHVELELA